MGAANRFLQNHPGMERELGIDSGHVIIDRDSWQEVKRILTEMKKVSEDNALPDEARIFVPGRLTDFEENLFLKREVKDLKTENDRLTTRLSEFDGYVVPLPKYKEVIETYRERLQQMNTRFTSERTKGKSLLAEVTRLQTLIEMSGVKARVTQNGLNYRKKKNRKTE